MLDSVKYVPDEEKLINLEKRMEELEIFSREYDETRKVYEDILGRLLLQQHRKMERLVILFKNDYPILEVKVEIKGKLMDGNDLLCYHPILIPHSRYVDDECLEKLGKGVAILKLVFDCVKLEPSGKLNIQYRTRPKEHWKSGNSFPVYYEDITKLFREEGTL